MENDEKSKTIIRTTKRHKNFEKDEVYEVEVTENKDGSISLSHTPQGSDGWDIDVLYLYPEQVEQLSEKLKQKCNGKNCPYYDGK